MVSLEDLRDDKPRFSMPTEALGEIRCYSIEYKAFERRIEQNVRAYRNKSSADLLCELFCVLATDQNEVHLNAKDFDALLDSERSEFADKIVESHKTIFSGKRSPRLPDETAAAYIARILIGRAEMTLVRNKTIYGWAGSSTAEALIRAQRLADPAQSSDNFKPPRIPPFRNPLDATNAHLASLESRFETSLAQTENLHRLVSSVNTAATGLLSRFATGAIANEKFGRLTIAVAVAALVVAVGTPILQICYDRYWKPPDPTVQVALDRLATALASNQMKTHDELLRDLTAVVDRFSELQRNDRRDQAANEDRRMQHLERMLQSISDTHTNSGSKP